MASKRIAIIGAGVGGLSAAARLGHRGNRVVVFEKLPRCGGRANIIEDAGYKFDTGPSFVLMPPFFEEAFSSCGRDIRQYLSLRQLPVHYTLFFADGQTLTVSGDRQETARQLERFEPGGAAAFEAFLAETGRFYRKVENLLYRSFTVKDLAHPRYWPLLFALRPWESFWHLARRFFRSEKLLFAFTFESMFMGVSPLQAPAFYSIITYADHVQKVFHPMGGMYEIPRQLQRLAGEFKVQMRYGCPVERLCPGKDEVRVAFAGQEEGFDAALVNADYAYSQRALLGRTLPQYRYSCSVFLIYLGIRRPIPNLAHHNLFFARDLFRNLTEIFQGSQAPQDPSFYVHVPTRTDPSLCPPGKEILYILVPVPNLKQGPEIPKAQLRRLRDLTLERISEKAGFRVQEQIEVEHTFLPQDFVSRYNIEYGATFGLAHNLMQSAFLRPANRDRRFPNLYYVGASTQPGGGLPVVLASARIVCDLIAGAAGGN